MVQTDRSGEKWKVDLGSLFKGGECVGEMGESKNKNKSDRPFPQDKNMLIRVRNSLCGHVLRR